MMSLYKNLINSMLIIIILSGCSYDMDFINNGGNLEYLKDKNGNNLRDCRNVLLTLRGGAKRFWQLNNLPEGTTEFVCVNGKAYLPGKEPK